MYFPFCWKTCIHTVNIFSKLATSENANLKNYMLVVHYTLCHRVVRVRDCNRPAARAKITKINLNFKK